MVKNISLNNIKKDNLIAFPIHFSALEKNYQFFLEISYMKNQSENQMD